MYADKCSRKFSVKFNHGGYFLGQGTNRSYVNGHQLWYDEVDADTWSPIMVENLVEEIGWEMAGRLKVYYCIPIMSINRNGLREIRGDSDTDQMLTFVSIGHYSFSLYLDHEDSLNANLTEDDVVNFPRVQLPPVFSPSKTRVDQAESTEAVNAETDVHVPEGEAIPIQVVYPKSSDVNVGNYVFARRNCSFGEQDENVMAPDVVLDSKQQGSDEAGSSRVCKRKTRQKSSSDYIEDAESDSDDSDFDPGAIVDSDYDISDGDDDLFADNVDMDEPMETEKKKEEKGKQKVEKGKEAVKGKEKDGDKATSYNHEDELYESEGDDLWAPDSDDEEVFMKFKAFRTEDLHCPKFHVGQVFQTVELLRKAIKEYCCKNRVDVKLPVNDKKRVKATCDEDCTWYLWASYDSRTKCFMVKKYVDEHTCTKKWKIKAFTAPFLAQKYLESFRADQDMNLTNFSRVVQKEWHMTPSRTKLQRARWLVMKKKLW